MNDNAPAGFWIRLAAHGVDAGIFMGLWMAWMMLVFVVQRAVGGQEQFLGGMVLLGWGLMAVGNGFYYVLMTRHGGQTLGKKAVGIKVVGLEAEELGYGRALGRWVGYALSYLTLYVGYALAGLTPGKRALHDYLAKTRVIRVGECSRALQIVLAILGAFAATIPFLLVFAVIVPALQHMKGYMGQAHERVTRSELGTMRSAVEMHRMDTARYPASLDELVGNQLDRIPQVRLPEIGHAVAQGVEVGEFAGPIGEIDPARLKDTGRWAYDPLRGKVFVDCTHRDRKGEPVYSW